MAIKEDIIFEVRNLSKIFKSVDMYGNTEMIKAIDNITTGDHYRSRYHNKKEINIKQYFSKR